jgi:hypothetical protein
LEDDGYGKLGLYLNALVYLGVCLGGLFSTSLLRTLLNGSQKLGMLLGAFLCVPYLLAFTLLCAKSDGLLTQDSHFLFLSDPSLQLILALTGFAHGFGEAILFVSQGSYLTLCATPTTKGFYFGFFLACYMSS